MSRNRIFAVFTLMVFLFQTFLAGCKKYDSKTATTGKDARTTAIVSQDTRSIKKTATTSITANASTNAKTEWENNEDNDKEDEVPDPQTDQDTGAYDTGPFAGLKFNANGIDLGGRTMQFIQTGPPKARDTGPAQAIFWERIENTERLFNVKIEFPQVSLTNVAYAEKIISNSLAGIKFADLMHNVSYVLMPNYVDQKFVLPVDDYIDFGHTFWKQTSMLTKYRDGKHYSIGRHDPYSIAPYMTVYNADILYQEGIEDILEIYRKKQWNWDTFLDICIKCTRDFNGDGILDQYGLSSGTANILMLSNGLLGMELDGENGFKCGYLDQRALNTFNFYRELSFVHKVIPSDSSATFQKGIIAIILTSSMPWYTLTQKMTANLKPAPLPAGPDVKEEHNIQPWSQCYSLTPVSDFKPEEVIAVYRYSVWNNPDDNKVFMDDYNNSFFSIYAYDNRYRITSEEDKNFWFKWLNETPASLEYMPGFTDLNTFISKTIIPAVNRGEYYKSVIDANALEITAIINRQLK
ncbi:MAG TPA: hypothetical protein DCY35_10845 [Prolixibacteraceae bacterium]|nr:hypothetical protein [Prolixibacteraceae bacterium]